MYDCACTAETAMATLQNFASIITITFVVTAANAYSYIYCPATSLNLLHRVVQESFLLVQIDSLLAD
jgi:hypothetical protein